jgi:hypothetical protein
MIKKALIALILIIIFAAGGYYIFNRKTLQFETVCAPSHEKYTKEYQII